MFRLSTKIDGYTHWWNRGYWTTFTRFATKFVSRIDAESARDEILAGETTDGETLPVEVEVIS